MNTDRRKRLSSCCGCGIILLLSMLLALLLFYWLVLPPLQWIFGMEDTAGQKYSSGTAIDAGAEWSVEENDYSYQTADEYLNGFEINTADLPPPPPPPPPPTVPILPAEEKEE